MELVCGLEVRTERLPLTPRLSSMPGNFPWRKWDCTEYGELIRWVSGSLSARLVASAQSNTISRGDGFLPVRQLSPRQWSAPMRHSSRTLSLLLAGRELPKSCEDIEWATGICNKTRRRSRLIILIDTGNIKNNVLKVKLFSESYTLTSMHGKFLQLCSLYLSKTV